MEENNEINRPETNTHETSQTQVDISQQPTTETTLPQKTNNKWRAVLTGLVVISLGIAIYFAYQNYQLRQQSTQMEPCPTSIPSETATTTVPKSIVLSTPPGAEISTSDWETYSNASAGFSIKHPAGWGKGGGADNWNWVGFGPQEIREDVLWAVSFYNKSEKTMAQIKDESGEQFDDRKQTEEAINLEGLTATKVVTTTNQYTNWYLVTIIIESDDMLYAINNGAQTDTALNEMLIKRTGKDYEITFEDYYTSFKLSK